ncbi:MAG TPA: hypothetical protein VLB84_10905 [Bacteroidia bacterium]|nr:hypothetical protein [Bacteroidia bacterium]
MKKALFVIFLFYGLCSEVNGQVSVNDSSVYVPIIATGYGHYFPGGDLVWRFKNNSSLFLDVDFKLKNYWMIGLNGSYLFGRNVKERLFDSISKDNIIINSEGDFADIRLYERGFTVSANAGRMFALNKKRPNCGIVFKLGLGFIQHKIRIEVIGNNVPQLSKEYKKGYDRLSNGFLLSQNLGYLYLSSNRLVNLYFGLECMEGFTQSRRSFDYDKMQRDTNKRLDILYGAKVAWILPLYKQAPKEYYTY